MNRGLWLVFVVVLLGFVLYLVVTGIQQALDGNPGQLLRVVIGAAIGLLIVRLRTRRAQS